MPTVIDTFLFAEAYEAELLLVKLHHEAPLIAEWVLIESDVTFRGDFKGLQARTLVESDPRFAPFRDRLHIIEQRGRLYEGGENYHTFYENEERSRALAWPYVSAKYPDDAWLIVSDVDESIDATDPYRLASFVAHLKRNEGRTVGFGHCRFWYDFDNYGVWEGVYTPVTQVGSVRHDRSSMACRSRRPGAYVEVRTGDDPLFFEYTFCFPKEAMWKKLNSFIHDKYKPEDLDIALLTNHWVKAPGRCECPDVNNPNDWMGRVELTEANSTAYVRANLGRLKTNAVDPDYLSHRRRLYGI